MQNNLCDLEVDSAVSCLIHLNFTIAISMMAMQAVFNTDPGPYYATILGTVTYQYRVSRTRASLCSLTTTLRGQLTGHSSELWPPHRAEAGL